MPRRQADENEKGRRFLGDPSIASPRYRGLTELGPDLGGATPDLSGGEIPGRNRRTRRKTMRHWITSFRLLKEGANMDRVRPIRKVAGIGAEAQRLPITLALDQRPSARR